MYKVLRKMESGETVLIADVQDLNQAKQLAEDFNDHWPGDYRIQESFSEKQIDVD